MQRIPILIRTAKQYNAVWRSGELIAVKSIKPGDAVTIQSQTQKSRGSLFSDYIFKATTKATNQSRFPRTNTFSPQPSGPAASNLCWKTIRRWQNAKRF